MRKALAVLEDLSLQRFKKAPQSAVDAKRALQGAAKTPAKAAKRQRRS